MFFGYNDRFWSKTSGALLRKVTTQSSRVTSVVEAGKSDVSVKFVILMVFSFLPRRCHPLTSCIKRITHQPYYNVIFFEKDRRQILKSVYHLLKSAARLLLFRLHILRAVLILNVNCFFITDHVALIM